jgi:hypothetical protein
MGLFDEWKERATSSLDNLSDTVYGYLETRVTDAVVKVGQPAGGNQTAAQVEAGQTGSTQPMAPVRSSVQMPLVLIAAAAAFILFSKRSRG